MTAALDLDELGDRLDLAATVAQHAACYGLPAGVFFPEMPRAGRKPKTGRRFDPYATARRVCAGCPVREDCLELALTGPEPYGFWGGTTEEERREIRRQRLTLAGADPAVCSVPGCGRPRQAIGLCHAHRMRVERNGDVGADRPIRGARA